MHHYIEIALFIAFIWGSTPFLTKHVLQNVDYKSLILCEAMFAFIISMIFSYYNRSEIIKDFKNVKLKTVFAILILVIAVFCVNIMYYNILRDHETYLISAITSIYPAIAFILSYLFLNEKITFLKALGVFLITSGIICIVK
jgi:uncharacterized membrane protein